MLIADVPSAISKIKKKEENKYHNWYSTDLHDFDLNGGLWQVYLCKLTSEQLLNKFEQAVYSW